MFTSSRNFSPMRRRGVVLVLVLALLSLLALIGVTFATLSGQAQVGARNYAAARAAQVNPETLFDYALNQLINDTNNPKSFLRGHSLLRDMYGHDARNSGFYPHMPEPLGWPMASVNGVIDTDLDTDGDGVVDHRRYRIETNIPTQLNPLIQQVPSLYGAYFGPYQLYGGGPVLPGWTVRMQQWVIDTTMQDATVRNPGSPIRQFIIPEIIVAGQSNDIPGTIGRTFEVIDDDVSTGWHIFTLKPIPLREVKFALDQTVGTVDYTDLPTPGLLTPDQIPTGNPPRFNLIQLENRYVRAFNGSGMSQEGTTNYIPPERINFGYNNPAYYLGNPVSPFLDPNNFNSPAMDENYDAVDHENVFLGLQSADGQVVIPSFHRPNTIVYDPTAATDPTANDWLNFPGTDPRNNLKRSKMLRPRKADHPLSGDSFPDLIPDPVTGKITYDVDNDGDGVTDAVWVDLGYPAQRSADGKLYKPLFAFTVIGLNGRLPLNTVGNMAARNPDDDTVDMINPDTTTPDTRGQPQFNHTSNLGYSPYEINPKYALVNSVGGNAEEADGSWLLRRILAGYDDPSVGVVEGRHGEAEALRLSPPSVPAAGRSYITNGALADFLDTNFNTTDFHPTHNFDYTNFTGTHPELPLNPLFRITADLRDEALRHQLSSERFRPFVTPIDINGAGRVMEWDRLPSSMPVSSQSAPYGPTNVRFGMGYDKWGRVSFYNYFRPPGVPAYAVLDIGNPDDITDDDVRRNIVNRLHGFESHRNPSTQDANVATRATVAWRNELFARAAFNVIPADPANINRRMPTFDNTVNSFNPPQVLQGMYPAGIYPNGSVFLSGGQGLNEEFQMNLFEKTPYDAPFDAGDLEWLYRLDDRDGSTLHSRLEYLAQTLTPNWKAFLNDDPIGLTAATRRKLFSVNVWDLNRTSWANNYFSPFNTPDLAHNGKKLNLNYPLPPYDPQNRPLAIHPSCEPVRQKWCREAFDLLVKILYPSFNYATFNPTAPGPGDPTPEAIGRIGQYVVNIVDFRDPDDVMTVFINPYLKVRAAGEVDLDHNGAPDDLDGDGAPDLVPAGVKWAKLADSQYSVDEPYDANSLPGAPDDYHLRQWGMEYLPVAINEVLAFQFSRKNAPGGTATATKRLFIELVNTLNEDANGDVGNGGSASHLNLNGWGLIITPDRPDYVPAPADPNILAPERPNTVTGQLSPATLKAYEPWHRDPMTNGPLPLLAPVEALDALAGGTAALPNHSKPGGVDRNYVLANTRPATAIAGQPPEVSSPEDANQVDEVLENAVVNWLPSFAPGSAQAEYFWVYLVRPADPNAPNMATEPMVVVDSFRFPYTESGGQVTGTAPGSEQVNIGNARQIYSLGRVQPYRGGHAVPKSHLFTPPYPYGYSEQASRDDQASNYQGMYYRENSMLGNQNLPIVHANNIRHSLGAQNPQNENWDFLPFLDRDFANVAELMLVPEYAPGLFTKKFVENSGRPRPVDAVDGFPGTPYVTPPNAPPGAVADLAEPHAYPYLPHRFNYWSTTVTGEEAGWYQLLDFFEVPSPVAGAIGPVARGDDGDWLRKDLRPGSINPNLIIDEEVFFALIDDVRLARTTAFNSLAEAMSPYNPTDPPSAAWPPVTPTSGPGQLVPGIPRLITSVYADGSPSFTQPISDLTAYPLGRGYYDVVNGATYMKAAFADFLKLRHGGSGFLGGIRSAGTDTYQYPNPIGNLLPEKPFRSFSSLLLNSVTPANPHLTIYDTLMRPARLGSISGDQSIMPSVLLPTAANANREVLATEVPPRMLFQVPFADDVVNPLDDSPASELGNIRSVPPGQAIPPPPFTPDHVNLSLPGQNADVFDPTPGGNGSPIPAYGNGGTGDFRRHPFWQTEILQKLIGNTTERTHQYAVWVTVGMFEVVLEGDAQKVLVDTSLAVDQLGKEIGKEAGTSVRYRAFFIVDRTRAVGFDPNNPSDFRPLLVYRKRIE